MLVLLRNSIRFAILFAALAACFTAGRALATQKFGTGPLILTSLNYDRVCGHLPGNASGKTICFPANNSSSNSSNKNGVTNESSDDLLTLKKPTDLFATSIATCALDKNEWKCWGILSGRTHESLRPVTETTGTIFSAGDDICRADSVKGLVSCSYINDMYTDPLIAPSSMTPDWEGTYFGPFTKLKAAAGAKE